MQKLTHGQQEVIKALNAFGRPIDDAGLAVYVHHVSNSDMSSSGVRTRRAELQRKGLVKIQGSKIMRSGRSAATHGLTKRGTKIAEKIV